MAGEWTSPDPAALIELAAINIERAGGGAQRLLAVRLARRLPTPGVQTRKKGSRKNISFHYDLGNDFYRSGSTPR